MGFDSIFHNLNLTLEVFFLDLLLSGDNAMVIALACRSLPPAQTRPAMLIGIGGAIVLRILLITIASLLLNIPMLKLVGGIALTVIAIKLTIEEEEDAESAKSPAPKPLGLWSTVGIIVVADGVMSVDNVVALAAVSQGSIFFLALGLLMSMPLLMFGSLFVTALLRRYPLLIRGGGALLGWIAGDLAISDPMFIDWVNQQAPALTVAVPILIAVLVLIESRIMENAQATSYALRPKRRLKPVITNSPPAVIEQAPAAAIITVASQSIEAEVPLPVSAAKTFEAPPQPKPGEPLPAGNATRSKVQAPRDDRFALWVWIAVAMSVALLWLYFWYFSLNFSN